MSRTMIAVGGALILLGVLLLLRCGGGATGPGGVAPEPAAHMLAYTDCKMFDTRSTVFYVSSNLDCISYAYDGESTLHITRTNAGFNCCPDSFTVSVDVDSTVITVTEVEWLTNPCHCLCLYDLEYEISGVPPGMVTLRIDEPYLESGDDTLELIVNLATNPVGSVCVTRNHYPWGQ